MGHPANKWLLKAFFAFLQLQNSVGAFSDVHEYGLENITFMIINSEELSSFSSISSIKVHY